MIERAESQFWAYEIDDKNTGKDLVLLDNVQFIYELSLAELELKAFGAEFEVTNGLREFKILNKSVELKEIIRSKGSYYKTFDGEFTDYYYIIQKNETRSVNQFLTHWIYPYKGKFHPQMIRALLNIIGLKEGDNVFEPFSGSGTTALEAQLLGINFIGIDVSPLCVIQGRVKTESIYVLDEILEIKDEVISKLVPNLFSPETNYYKMIKDLTSDERVRNFYKMARLLAVSDNSRRKRDFRTSFIKNLNLMVASVKDFIEIKERLNLNLGNVKTEIGDSRNVKLSDNSIDGIITSPPYSIALDYIKNDVHSFKDLGCDVSKMKNDFIGVRGIGKSRVELYNEDIKKSYSEMHRVLKPNKYAVIVIGNATYQGKEIKTVEFTIKYMENIGFKLVKNINKIIFGLYNVMKKENILIFRKEK
ncbi:MAG: Modification methylase MjaII [Candidatus Methanolliviera sp. GoM_oil]|nr:MAG: Modification methylase MjaII [Candidatus Methanolliviera sp. GoM_oil]